eukprot:SM000013S26470  [mRNA]  locus=s13:584393:587005:- [translate_table: standard]
MADAAPREEAAAPAKKPRRLSRHGDGARRAARPGANPAGFLPIPSVAFSSRPSSGAAPAIAPAPLPTALFYQAGGVGPPAGSPAIKEEPRTVEPEDGPRAATPTMRPLTPPPPTRHAAASDGAPSIPPLPSLAHFSQSLVSAPDLVPVPTAPSRQETPPPQQPTPLHGLLPPSGSRGAAPSSEGGRPHSPGLLAFLPPLPLPMSRLAGTSRASEAVPRADDSMAADGARASPESGPADQSLLGAAARLPPATLTEEIRVQLEAVFSSNHSPSREARKELAVKTGLSADQIATWFQNRRMRLKRSEATDSGSYGGGPVVPTFAAPSLPVASASQGWTVLGTPATSPLPLAAPTMTQVQLAAALAASEFEKDSHSGTSSILHNLPPLPSFGRPPSSTTPLTQMQPATAKSEPGFSISQPATATASLDALMGSTPVALAVPAVTDGLLVDKFCYGDFQQSLAAGTLEYNMKAS